MPKKLSERLIKWIKAQKCTGADRGWRYLMVELAQCIEALVEAKEPEEHTCEECEFYIQFLCRDAPGYFGGWKFTKPNTTACKRFVVSSPEPEDTELAEAKTWAAAWKRAAKKQQALFYACSEISAKKIVKQWRRIKKLRKRKEWWKHSIESWKAEEQSWRDERDELGKELVKAQAKISDQVVNIGLLRAEAREYQRLLALARDEEGQLKADAAFGRLVRAMQPGTRLTKARTNRYWSEQQCGETWVSVGPQVAMLSPTEALRSIQQEVDDAKS